MIKVVQILEKETFLGFTISTHNNMRTEKCSSITNLKQTFQLKIYSHEVNDDMIFIVNIISTKYLCKLGEQCRHCTATGRYPTSK